ncbi:hypothetical protein ACTXT7_008545 [Hymenolepis weldensis]
MKSSNTKAVKDKEAQSTTGGKPIEIKEIVNQSQCCREYTFSPHLIKVRAVLPVTKT